MPKASYPTLVSNTFLKNSVPEDTYTLLNDCANKNGALNMNRVNFNILIIYSILQVSPKTISQNMILIINTYDILTFT